MLDTDTEGTAMPNLPEIAQALRTYASTHDCTIDDLLDPELLDCDESDNEDAMNMPPSLLNTLRSLDTLDFATLALIARN